ncbi:hypothetical protein PR202_ga09954 [Eleusine coracana subsp. coracana]|uniref:FHA domain-containing protein n=1 Tax=Eleusine coracana subsp. coracana TaxID=191504 RepID=A0AAV5C4V5_ELECO|nr:hypothetical protein PR202_ga09954 [Eleusine coracana subsp. coracana]
MHKGRGKLSGVLHKGFKPDKCKTSLKMGVARINLLRNRKEVAVRQMRHEVAQLLEANQDQTARIRVVRLTFAPPSSRPSSPLRLTLRTCPIDLKEAIASVIFASMRCADVPELADVRKHFTSKYGKEFAAAALEVRPDSGVNRLVIEKLSAGAPDVQTKIKTLTSIAEEHNIKWEPKAFEEKLQKPNEDLLAPYSSASATAVDSAASHVPMGPTPADVSMNNASLEENRMGSKASAPLSSQYSASNYYSAQIPGSNNFSHENPGGQSVSRPYSQYDASAPGSVSRDEEISQPRERKTSVSGANWNMEFKDATSAAQAAAESAEMASIAARAAAQLASRGNYSGEHSTGGFESGAYSHQNTPRKQTAAHFMKDEKRSFNDQSSRSNDPRMTSSNQGKHSTGAETSRPDSQNMRTDYNASQDVHSYNAERHADAYGMPFEPHHAHSPDPPHSDDLYDRESSIGRRDHHMDFPGEKFQDTALGGHNVSDVNNQVSSDHESTDDHYGNYSSSHGTFTHGSRTVWDNQTDKTQVNSSSAVFDQYDSDVEEENLFDTFASKHTEQLPGVHDNMESSNADWSQLHRNDCPSDHRTSVLFSRTDTHKSDTSEANRRDIPSPRSYDNLPPTFDSDGNSSDEEIAARPTAKHAEILRSHSKGSTNSGKLVRDVNESTEDYYESSSGKKSGLNVSYKEQPESGHSPRYDYSRAQAQRNFSHGQSRDSDISDDESEPESDKLEVASSIRGNENQSFPFAQRTSASLNDEDESDFGLNFSRLTPGLRNKPKQPPPYPKSSRENLLPRQSLNKASVSIEESVDSEEDTTSESIRSTTKSSRSTKTFSGGGYSGELYDRSPRVETPKEARSTMARNSFHADDTENLSVQFGNASLLETKGSERRNSAQKFYQQKPEIGGHRQMRPRMTKTFFDSDDSDQEVEQRQAQSKWPAEQIPSRRTSGAKRDGLVQTRAQYADESESMPKETKVTQAFSNSHVEQRRDRPDPSVPVQRPSAKTEPKESSIARGKLQKAEIDTHSVPANESTETSGTPKESTAKTVAAHVHPKLPTDYDSFAAHFKSLRTNRR